MDRSAVYVLLVGIAILAVIVWVLRDHWKKKL